MLATASCLAVLLVLYCRVDRGVTECTNCTGENCEKDCGRSVEANACPLSKILPQCATIDQGSDTCVDNQSYIGANIGPQWINCCNHMSCPNATGQPVAPKLEVLSNTWTAVSLTMATLHLQWSAVIAVRHQLVITVNNGSISTVRCMCLPASVLHYQVNVSLSAGTSLHVEISGLPYSMAIGRYLTTNQIDIDIPSDCWDTDDKNSSLEKCGPSAPQNLNIAITPANKSSVLLSVSWEPPLTYTTSRFNIIAYKIVWNDTAEVIISVANQTIYQHNLTSPAVHKYIIKVYASYGEVNNSTECEEYNVTNDVADDSGNVTFTLCWGQAAIATNILPSITPSTTGSSSSSSKSEIVLIIIISSVIILVLVVVVIILLTFVRSYKTKVDQYLSLVVDGDNCAVRRVFIINAPQSNDEDLCLVRRLCHNLADNSVKPVNYEYSTFDRQHGPGQSGIHQWAENNFTECDMTLFVCNKSFQDAWNNRNTDQNSLISASKLLLQGHFSSSQDVSRFGVILLRRSDDQYIPSLYLKSFQKFVVFQNDQCVIEALLDQMYSDYEN